MIESLVNTIQKLIYKKEDVFILGHDVCDVDSFFSGILLDKYLKFLGVNSNFVIKDEKMDETTIKILESLNYKVDKFKSNVDLKDKKVILVDHYETTYSYEVLGIIDHHKNTKKNSYNFCFQEEIGSCCSLIQDTIVKLNKSFLPYEFSYEDLNIILISLIVDTNSLKSNKFRDRDREKIESILSKLEFSYIYLNYLISKYTTYTDLTQNIYNIATNGYKEYLIGNSYVKSSYMSIKEYKKNLLVNCSNVINREEFDIWVFMVFFHKENKTLILYINKDKSIEYVRHNSIVSRGSYVIPNLEKKLLKI